ncbi:MAG: sulfite exporter TauE/SafE family protein [Spirochaetes bacterium]|nr:sulfite exporter TauE/SafE family protein [Spirochaetota bacterium]
MDSHAVLLPVLFFGIAFLYSSVGHAGASGYLAVMALVSAAPESIRPTALILNIVVASVASVQYLRAGCFDARVFFPFALLAVPSAYLGGRVALPGHGLKAAIGVVLLASACLMLVRAFLRPRERVGPPPIPIGLLGGGAIGFISGLTAVGGGIFLSPLLLYFGWAEARKVSGVAAVFILVNSIAGLLGQAGRGLPHGRALFLAVVAVLVGGLMGSRLGSTLFDRRAILSVLFLVLVIAGVKMIAI